MRIAVIEHRLTGDSLEDARSLGQSAIRAAEAHAEAVFLPAVVQPDDAQANAVLEEALRSLPATYIIPKTASQVGRAFGGHTDSPIDERLGKAVMLLGDACVDSAQLSAVARSRPAVLVLNPRSESELQAEAFVELAVGLSESAAGLVIVAEAVGAEPGDPGHGGSAVVLLGEVIAESVDGDGGILYADVPEPVPHPSAPNDVPELPTILAQRQAQHAGRKLDMGYFAELT